ncbi:hypothetical protein Acsp01_55980 [Actinoplanes sp. NBRC 101535]|nr:hypothetical protein Acsp01_55980 [Actinoplanes sp. NBRC 101535]
MTGGERDPVGAPEHPPAVFLALVGEVRAEFVEQVRQEFGQGRMVGQRDVGAVLRGPDGDTGQTGIHQDIPPRTPRESTAFYLAWIPWERCP